MADAATTRDAAVPDDQHHHDTCSQSISGRRNNNIVAESDLEAALKGIRDCFAEYHQQQRDDENDDPQQLANVSKKVKQKLMTSIQESFCKNLERAVQPVSDNAYHVFLHRNQNTEDGFTNVGAASAVSPDQVNHYNFMETEEYDEESLLDQPALEMGRDLRIQVRRSAQHVSALRKSILDRTVALAHRQIQLWRAEQHLEIGQEEDNGNDLMQVVDSEFTFTTRQEQLREMEQSLRTLIQSLQQATTEELPNKMEKLQDAIETVENGIVENDKNRLFQTETELRGDAYAKDDEWEKEWAKMTADKKVAVLFNS